MRILREENSTRLRASIRGVLPAVLTLVVFLGGRAILGALFIPTGAALPLDETILVRFILVVLYVVMIGIAVWCATSLDRRHYTEFGLEIDKAWVRNFIAGAVLSVSGIAVSLWWGIFRGFRDIDVSAEVNGPDGPIFFGFALIVFVLYFLLGNLYEEFIYRGVMIQNFAEGLTARGFSPVWAVAPATAVSLMLFGLYHIPLRGNFVVAFDAALVGSTFALAYLLTGELGLPLGVHFGRISIELLTGFEILKVVMPAMVEFPRNTLMANIEVKLLELGVICLFILIWVYLTNGELQIAETVYDAANDGSDTG